MDTVLKAIDIESFHSHFIEAHPFLKYGNLKRNTIHLQSSIQNKKGMLLWASK
jgi:hypothetical protein